MTTTYHPSTPILVAFAALAATACTGDTTPPAADTRGVSPEAARKEPRKVTDELIANAVDRTLLTDAALHNKQIDVKVDHGVVTLTGSVDTLMVQERASKLAQTIRGVRSVVNTVALDAPSRTDDKIRTDVQAALRYDAATDALALTEEVKDGVVTLRGAVPSYREKQLALYVAKSVRGVRGVTDSMALTAKNQRADAEIAREVERAIGIDVWLHPGSISASVRAGEVTLLGSVGSAAQYERACTLAWTAGVTSVNAHGLKIEPWAKPIDQRPEAITVKGDAQVKQAVHDAFLADPRVSSYDPRVEVDKGAVTLTGVVTSLKAKRAAEQDAKNTWGVWRVHNLLKTRPAKPVEDDTLAQNVTAALLRDATLDGYELKVRRGKARSRSPGRLTPSMRSRRPRMSLRGRRARCTSRMA